MINNRRGQFSIFLSVAGGIVVFIMMLAVGVVALQNVADNSGVTTANITAVKNAGINAIASASSYTGTITTISIVFGLVVLVVIGFNYYVRE